MPRTLTSRQEMEMAIAIGQGDKPNAVADMVGCSVKTVFRRMDDPEFMLVVEKMKAQAYQDLPRMFRESVVEAFKTILDLAKTADRDSTRLTASKMLLDYAGVKPLEAEDAVPSDVGEEDIYAIRGADGIYRKIEFLPSGRVEHENADSGT